jgi:hypothetical protein
MDIHPTIEKKRKVMSAKVLMRCGVKCVYKKLLLDEVGSNKNSNRD